MGRWRRVNVGRKKRQIERTRRKRRGILVKKEEEEGNSGEGNARGERGYLSHVHLPTQERERGERGTEYEKKEQGRRRESLVKEKEKNPPSSFLLLPTSTLRREGKGYYSEEETDRKAEVHDVGNSVKRNKKMEEDKEDSSPCSYPTARKETRK